MGDNRRSHAADLALLFGSFGAVVLTYQSWGLAAAVAAAIFAGLVGLRRGLSLPLAVAASSAAGAALVHFAVAPEHFGEWWGFGLFFVLCGEAQLGWALLLDRHHGRRMLAAGIAGSLLLVGLWAFSRTTGLPFGPEPGVPEAAGVPDLASVMFELFTAGACAWALFVPRRASGGLAVPVRAFGLIGTVVLTAWALLSVGSA